MVTAQDVITELKRQASDKIRIGKSHFGIQINTSLGLSAPQLKTIARQLGKNQELANELWKSDIHEARHVAILIAEKKKITDELMERWLKDFNSWDIVDNCCGVFFIHSPHAYQKAIEWTSREKEYEKRAGFALMCFLAVHDKKANDEQFEQFFPYIYKESSDNRNFVKKAVNWAIRQIGKRNTKLCEKAIALSHQIKLKDDDASRWIASGALRELEKYLAEGKIRK